VNKTCAIGQECDFSKADNLKSALQKYGKDCSFFKPINSLPIVLGTQRYMCFHAMPQSGSMDRAHSLKIG